MFTSFIQAGFECSTHKRFNGQRLDLVRSTSHDRFARNDFERLKQYGITTVREGARWHLIESTPRSYEFETLDVILDAASETGIEVILDLLHFGWPDHLDILSEQFAEEFGRYVAAVAKYLRRRERQVRFITPINEISFLSWGGGSKGCINPYRKDCAPALKDNLIRAACTGSEILLGELPGVRLISTEPIINIVGDPSIEGDQHEAERYRLAQFEAWDMLAGLVRPELGGRPEYLDILGANFYDRNQWMHNSRTLGFNDAGYRPLRYMLQETWGRYQRPMFISETGAEDGFRAEWFTYVCDEVEAARAMGVPIHGICLYPILNHPGWDDDRHCQNGLLDMPDDAGNRNIHWPLAKTIRAQQRRFQPFNHVDSNELDTHRSHLSFSPPLGLRFSAPPTSDESFREDEAGVFP
jgi:hypothetical protein